MTDKEKLIALKSYVYGGFAKNKTWGIFERENFENFLKSLDNNETV